MSMIVLTTSYSINLILNKSSKLITVSNKIYCTLSRILLRTPFFDNRTKDVSYETQECRRTTGWEESSTVTGRKESSGPKRHKEESLFRSCVEKDVIVFTE